MRRQQKLQQIVSPQKSSFDNFCGKFVEEDENKKKHISTKTHTHTLSSGILEVDIHFLCRLAFFVPFFMNAHKMCCRK